jgi:cytochrome c-type biogenesis protein CcmH/NrfF
MLASFVAIGASVAFALASTTTLQMVSEALTCQCGCGLTVANCNHPQCEFSVPIRTEIETMISKGLRQPQIIAQFRTKYGEKILSAPTSEGFNLLAWIMPFAVLLGGGGLVLMALARWHGRKPAPAPQSAPSEGDTELKRRLEREFRESL